MRAFALLFCAVFSTTVVTIVPVLPAPALAANLIADGGFEANPVSLGGYAHHAGGTSFDGGKWFATGVDVLQIDRAYAYGTPSMTFASHNGRNSLDLTGTGNSSPLDGVYQDVATAVGQLYKLTFWTARATGIGTSANDYPASAATVRLSVGGAGPLDFINTDTLVGGLAWREFSHVFAATDAMTRLAFVNGDGNSYLGLDDVSLIPVAAVPEPASWAMLIAGLFTIGGTGARLRRIKFSRTAR